MLSLFCMAVCVEAQPTNNAVHTTAIEAMRAATAGRVLPTPKIFVIQASCLSRRTGILPGRGTSRLGSLLDLSGWKPELLWLWLREAAVPAHGAQAVLNFAASAFTFVAISGLVSQLSLLCVFSYCPGSLCQLFFVDKQRQAWLLSPSMG
jgi:hypothetical protein